MGICVAKANQKVSEPQRTASNSVASTTLRKRLLELKKVDNAPTLRMEQSRTYRKRLDRLSTATEATDCSPCQQ